MNAERAAQLRTRRTRPVLVLDRNPDDLSPTYPVRCTVRLLDRSTATLSDPVQVCDR